MDTILTRRSIRRYTDKPVPPELVEQLLRAGMAAPSACNEPPWHFLVIDDRAQLDLIPTIHPYARMILEASVAVIVCSEPALKTASETVKDYWVQDCSAAAENMLLAAHGLGLGGVWLGVYPRPERVEPIKKLFALPEGITPLCILSFGYPAEHKEPSNRYDPTRVHHNRWQEPK
ncbi:MAG: nitroreductase family protein [Acetanaerobacterium sp.]